MMKRVYCIVQRGSSPSYRLGIIAICTSVKSAIKLMRERYERDIVLYKPTEHKFETDGIFSNYMVSENAKDAWIKVEIQYHTTNNFIR